MRAKVISVHSGSEYKDGRRHVTLKFEGAELMYCKLIIPDEELKLDEVVHFSMEAAVTA